MPPGERLGLTGRHRLDQPAKRDIMNTRARFTRTAIRLTIGAAASVPMLFFAAGIASATDATVTQSEGPNGENTNR
jgi:hypothetical protein